MLTVDIADQSNMLSQGEDDDSEEADIIKTSVSQSFFHDVIRHINEFSGVRQQLHCDVIVGKQ